MRFSLFLFGLWLLAAGVAGAADTTPPAIDHKPLTESISDTSLAVTAGVTDNEKVRRVTLYMRSAGTSNYYAIPMSVKGDVYRGVIPANFVTVGTLEYYIEALDTAGNIGTAPQANASVSPYQIKVSRDTTEPDATLRYPDGAVSGDSVVVVVLLSDAAQNVDPGSVKVMLNGRDITADAQISQQAITYVAQVSDLASISALKVTVKDRAGNEITKQFRVYKLPDFAGQLNLDYSSTNGAGEFAWSASADAAWGPFSASASLQSDDPAFSGVPGQPTNTFQLAYDSKILDAQIGDVTTTLSPMSANGFGHRGYNALIDLGPLETTIGSGLSAQYVAGDTYAQRFTGLREALNLWILDAGFNVSEVIDQEAAGIGTNPEQNYVITADVGTKLWQMQAGFEAGASMYFPNARGNLWNSLGTLSSLPSPFDQIGASLQNVPQGVRKYLPLPDPQYWLLDLPFFDVGAQASLKTPLPWSSAEANYFRVGPDFRTTAGSADADKEGLGLSWSSRRLFNVVQLSADYEDYQDNVRSLLDMVGNNPAEPASNRNRYKTMSGGASFRTSWGTLSFDGEQESTNGDKTLAAVNATPSDDAVTKKDETDTISAKLSGIKFQLGGYETSVGGSVTRATYDDKQTAATNDKVTTTSKVSADLSQGAWSYGVGYTAKNEVDAGGASVNSPSFDLKAGWSQRDVSWGSLTLQRVKADLSTSFGSSKGTSEDSSSSQYAVKVQLEPSDVTQWVAQYKVKTSTDNLAGTSDTDTTVSVGYALRF